MTQAMVSVCTTLVLSGPDRLMTVTGQNGIGQNGTDLNNFI